LSLSSSFSPGTCRKRVERKRQHLSSKLKRRLAPFRSYPPPFAVAYNTDYNDQDVLSALTALVPNSWQPQLMPPKKQQQQQAVASSSKPDALALSRLSGDGMTDGGSGEGSGTGGGGGEGGNTAQVPGVKTKLKPFLNKLLTYVPPFYGRLCWEMELIFCLWWMATGGT
jgi:hypothetical protein